MKLKELVNHIHTKEDQNDFVGETPVELSKELSKEFHKIIKTTIKKHFDLKDIKTSDTYFSPSSFVEIEGKIFYISLADVRYSPESQVLIRTASSFKDYTGGANNYVSLEKFETAIIKSLENFGCNKKQIISKKGKTNQLI